MNIYLAKTLEGMKRYGQIYDLSMEPEDRVEVISFGEDENRWFLKSHVDNVNAACGTLLDDGDVDYIGEEGCKILIRYFEDVNTSDIESQYRQVIDSLLDYAKRAIQYHTGIVIEM